MDHEPNNQVEAMRRQRRPTWTALVENALQTRFFPEVWYISEAWLGSPRGKNILVVGYGLGLMSEALAKSGWNVTTINPSLSALKNLRERFSKAKLEGDFELAPLSSFPFPGRTFHAVVSINTLEFCENPLKVLKEMHRVLKPEGRAVVSTSNRFSPWNLGPITRLMHPDDAPQEITCLSRSEFQGALEIVQFKIESIKARAHYLPLPKLILPIKLPIPGAYVALLSKPAASMRP